jgi:hypothetical protein
MTPQQLAADVARGLEIRQEIARWTPLVKSIGLKMD